MILLGGKDYEKRIQALLGSLPPRDAEEWRHRLQTLLDDCGCKVGAVTMIIAMVGWLVRGLTGNVIFMAKPNLLLGVGTLFGSAVIGKCFGLLIARLRFELAVRRLQKLAATFLVRPKGD